MSKGNFQTIIGSIDTPDVRTWDSEVAKTLGIPEDIGSDEDCLASLLILPSFHPEFGIHINAMPNGARLRFVTQGTNLWGWGCFQRMVANRKWRPDQPAPSAPIFYSEDQFVLNERLFEYQNFLKHSAPERVGCPFAVADGIRVVAEWRSISGCIVRGDSNGPNDPTTFEVAHHGVTLALSLMKSEQSIGILRDAIKYFN